MASMLRQMRNLLAPHLITWFKGKIT